jgi:organic radical activating enzyme
MPGATAQKRAAAQFTGTFDLSVVCRLAWKVCEPQHPPARSGHLTFVSSAPNPSLTPRDLFTAWGRILSGRIPMLSIEITRECPLSCPGCYAYGDTHLGGGVTLSELSDKRGDELVEGVLQLVRKHKPLHVSLVGGEPMVRQRELIRILPALSKMNVFSLVVTSGVIPISMDLMNLRRCRVAVSVDGLPEHHDIRRKPATYQRILKNIEGRKVNVHWVITRPMLERAGYLEEYVDFWNARSEVDRIWVSVYTPQVGEQSPEMLTQQDREVLAHQLPSLSLRYRKLLFNEGLAQALIRPPKNPDECVFAKMSANYSADLETRVEPCVFGGTPDCSQCGCAISLGLHWIGSIKLAGPVKIDHFIAGSVNVGLAINRLRSSSSGHSRWNSTAHSDHKSGLVQIQP